MLSLGTVKFKARHDRLDADDATDDGKDKATQALGLGALLHTLLMTPERPPKIDRKTAVH